MSDKKDRDFLGKKILQNCRNELYLDFPYLDGAFAGLEYEADSSITSIQNKMGRRSISIRFFF